jgi:hypothetical protein
MLANRILSGDLASAGALLKLLSSNPYLTDVDRARELVLNLAHWRWKVMAGLGPFVGRRRWRHPLRLGPPRR